MSGTKKTLVAVAPDGQRVTKQTSGDYDYAGLLKTPTGWHLYEKGWSYDSVRNRTRASYNRHPVATNYTVVPFREIVPKEIEEYFAPRAHMHAAPIVRSVFSPSTGWIDASSVRLAGWAGLSLLRRIQRTGFTTVAVGDASHPAEFGLASLLPRGPAPRHRSKTYVPHLGQSTRGATTAATATIPVKTCRCGKTVITGPGVPAGTTCPRGC